MKKLFLILAFLSLTSCKSQNSKSNGLNNCLEKEYRYVLKDGLIDFELQLESRYSELDKEERYVKFLKDFIDMNIESEFFLSSKTKLIRDKVRTVKIWTLIEDIEELEFEVRLDVSEPEKGKEILGLTKTFKNCLITEVPSSAIKNFLVIQSKVPNISTRLSAIEIYDGINENDFNHELNRMVVAVAIYYEFGYNLEK